MLDAIEYPWREGLKTGIAAWIVGFAVIGGLLSVPAISDGSYMPVEVVSAALVFFFASHGWPLLLVGTIPVTPVLFLPVPLMILFAGGYRLIYVTDVPGDVSAYRIGAGVTTGYAPATLVGIAVLTTLSGGLGSIPVYVVVFVFSGVVVPVVAGGIGGAVAAR